MHHSLPPAWPLLGTLMAAAYLLRVSDTLHRGWLGTRFLPDATPVALGEYRGLLALGMALGNFYLKARKEERFLSLEFGEKFSEHTRHAGMFLPKLS